MLICVINSIPKLLASLILEVNEFVIIGIIFFLRGSIYLHILVTVKLSDERLIRAHVFVHVDYSHETQNFISNGLL